MESWNNFPTTQNPPRATPDAQAPLGSTPSYDDVLDVAVQYTFPCSDPIAVDECCAAANVRALHPEREEGGACGLGMAAGQGETVNPGKG